MSLHYPLNALKCLFSFGGDKIKICHGFHCNFVEQGAHTAKPWESLFSEQHTHIKEGEGRKLYPYSEFQDEGSTPISDLGGGLGIFAF